MYQYLVTRYGILFHFARFDALNGCGNAMGGRLDSHTQTFMPVAVESYLERVKTPSPMQRAACEYYAMGLSIGPTMPASKQPHLWKRLAYMRIDPRFIPELFDNDAGIFVMTGSVSRNLVILDCETKETFQHHAVEFYKRGLKPWQVLSARGGHFWWLSADGELDNVSIREFPGYEAEIRGRLLYALCPPSIHPTGVLYEWQFREGKLPPLISVSELDWLPVRLAFKVRPRFELRNLGPYDCLSHSTRDFMHNGAAEGSRTRNSRFFSAACDMHGNGFEYEEAERLLVPVAIRCGLGKSDIYSSLKSAYRKNRTPAKQSRRGFPELVPDWLKARSWAESHDWIRMETIIEK